MHRIAAKAAVLQGRSSVALLLGFTSAFTTTTTDIKCTTTLAAVACCCYCLCTQETSSSQSSVAKFWVQNASLLKQRSSSLFKTRGESRQEIIGVLFVSKNWKRLVRRCLFIRTKKCFRYITVFENHKKVSFNIASEASYVYILSGQKLIKNAKIGPFGRAFENLKLAVKQCYQTGQF